LNYHQVNIEVQIHVYVELHKETYQISTYGSFILLSNISLMSFGVFINYFAPVTVALQTSTCIS